MQKNQKIKKHAQIKQNEKMSKNIKKEKHKKNQRKILKILKKSALPLRTPSGKKPKTFQKWTKF